MFRFFRKENLKSSRRRSASCPNLQHSSTEEIHFDGIYQKGKAVDDFLGSSESDQGEDLSDSNSKEPKEGKLGSTNRNLDPDEHDSANKLERLNAQRSVKRFKHKEREKKENAGKNLISMDDYHGKLSELKMWLQEEGKKDVSNIKSPKLKSHFKAFIKLWNKRKLPAKYYKSLSVDLTKVDQPAPVEGSSFRQYIQHADLTPAPSVLPALPPPLDLSSDDHFSSVGSPFSTFGKTPDNPNSTPAFLAKQMSTSHAVEQNSNFNNKESTQVDLDLFTVPSLDVQSSPQKFATISRSTPVTSLFKLSTQPWTSRENALAPAFPSPVCPKVAGTNFTMAHKNKPPGSQTLPCNFPRDVTADDKDLDKWIAGWNKFTDQSPIYDTVMDAIQCSSESPIYTEIDADIHTDYQYPSVSLLKSRGSPVKETKQTDLRQPSLNRRRSKSMEDLYSVSSKCNVGKKWPGFLREDSIQSQPLPPPPIPEKKFSPKKLFSSFISPSVAKIQTVVGLEGKSHLVKSPSLRSNKTVASDLASSANESNTQKRRSQESVECTQEQLSSPVKKAKADCQSHTVGHSAQFANIKNLESSSSLESFQDSFTSSTNKLSILTGSLHPTTRSKHKLNDSDASHNSHAEKSDVFDAELGVLELKQLEESPKFPRRRLKRRSSSFSTTPGKGLTFGKSSKVSGASPRRRVSFAKDVKDAEDGGGPKRRSSNRMVVPPNSAKFSKQSKDRMEFESFMSAHTSPPRKSNSPAKLPSPEKVSPKKLPSPQKRSDEVTRLEKVRADPPPSSPQKQRSPAVTSPSDEKLFPTSPVKQLGRRIIGKPTASSPPSHVGTTLQISPSKYFNKKSTSPQKTFNGSPRKLSPPKKLLESQLALPKKTINSLVSKLGEKTSTICGTEMSESEGYSSSDDLLNGAVLTNGGCGVKKMDYCSRETNSAVKSLGQRENEKDPFNGLPWRASGSFNANELSGQAVSHEFPPEEIRPTASNKTASSKPDLLDRNFNSANACVKNVGEAHDCYSKYSSDLLNHLNDASCDWHRDASGSVAQRSPAQMSREGKAMHMQSPANIGLKTDDPIAPPTELERFELKALLGNSGAEQHCQENCYPIKDNQEGTNILRPALDNLTSLPSAIHHTEDNHVRDNPVVNHSQKRSITSSLTREMSPFTARLTQLDAEGCKSPICGLDEKVPSLGHGQMDYEKLWDTENNNECSEQDQKRGLERLLSIRASPKIVDNDGWITERRRSSKGKTKASFRSAYNSHMLRSSSQEGEEEMMGQILSMSEMCSSPEHSSTNKIVTQKQAEVTSKTQIVPVRVVSPSGLESPSLDLSSPHTVAVSQKPETPGKIKPAVMPKPTRTLTLAQRRINQNSPALRTNAASKRRSSLNAKEASSKHKEDYISKNISAVRSDSSRQANAVTSMTQETVVAARKRSTAGDVNQLTNRLRSKTASHDVDAPSGRRVSKMVEEGETSRVSNRRRSRTTYQEDENKIPSFTDRKKFFQQLQTKVEQKQPIRLSPQKQPIRLSPQKQPIRLSPQKQLIRLSPQKQQRGLASIQLNGGSDKTWSSPSLKHVNSEQADSSKQFSHNYSVETQI